MDICGWLWNSTVGLNSLGFSGKNSRKKQVFFFGGITFKVYRFLPLSECRAFLLNLLKAEMTESEEALTVNWDGEVSESYQTAKLTSGRLLDLGTRLVMEPGSAAHCSGVCCFWNSSLQNTCGMLFSPFFITGKVLFQFLPVGERGTAVGPKWSGTRWTFERQGLPILLRVYKARMQSLKFCCKPPWSHSATLPVLEELSLRASLLGPLPSCWTSRSPDLLLPYPHFPCLSLVHTSPNNTVLLSRNLI